MSNKKSTTKKALFSSIVSLLLCFTMLLGTTFAWFTDTVTSSGNKIQAGTLQVGMEYRELDGTWINVEEGVDPIFSFDNIEPGYTMLRDVRISNNGSLAIQWQLNIVPQPDTNATPTNYDLADVIDVYFAIIEEDTPAPGSFADAQANLNYVGTLADLIADADGAAYGVLLPEDGSTDFDATEALAANAETGSVVGRIALHMQETAGNDYQGLSIGAAFDMQLLATQFTYENDSFDNDYDENATYPWVGDVDTSWYNDTETTFEIYTAEQLAGLSKLSFDGNNFAGKTIRLMENIDLSGNVWAPINSFAGEFDGNGNTISNFVIDATNARGGFFNVIEAGEGERVHDLTIKGVDATVGNSRFGTLANSIHGIVNRVTVTDVEVTTTDSNAWVGGMCAFMSWPWMNDCTVENMVVDATSGAEFVSGFSPILQKNSNMVFDNCDVNGFTVTVADTDGACGVGGFVGQTQRGWENPKMTNCDITGIDITASGTVDIGGFMPWPGAHTIAENCSTSGIIDATGVTGADNFVGGFFGNLGWNCDLGQMGHVITNCTADVDIISGGAPAGGFVGSATNSNDNSMYATFNNCSAKGDVTNTNGVAGGFAGDADRGSYNNCSASGTVTGTIAGGFIGHIKDVTPKYDHRYPAGTREYLVDEIFIVNCTGTAGLNLIAEIATGADVTIDGVAQ